MGHRLLKRTTALARIEPVLSSTHKDDACILAVTYLRELNDLKLERVASLGFTDHFWTNSLVRADHNVQLSERALRAPLDRGLISPNRESKKAKNAATPMRERLYRFPVQHYGPVRGRSISRRMSYFGA